MTLMTNFMYFLLSNISISKLQKIPNSILRFDLLKLLNEQLCKEETISNFIEKLNM